jgi:hypothetical protein
MEKISWTNRVRNEEALHIDEDDRIILPTINRRKSYWLGHILRSVCLLKRAIEGKREVKGRRGRKRKPLLDDFK